MSVPGYLAKESELKAMGVDKVVVLAVNDAAVMTAWAKDQKVPSFRLDGGRQFCFLFIDRGLLLKKDTARTVSVVKSR